MVQEERGLYKEGDKNEAKSLFDKEDKIEEGSLFIKNEDILNEKKDLSDEKLDDNSNETSLGEHPRLGKLIKVSVHSTSRANKNSVIPTSIGKYHFDINPGKEVILPEKIIELLEQSMDTFGVFDPDATSESGFKGVTTMKEEPNYIVKRL